MFVLRKEYEHMGILEEMYYGKFECQERTRCNKELVESSKLCDRNGEKLLLTMTEEQKSCSKSFLIVTMNYIAYQNEKVLFKDSNSLQNL